jgi:hypothetical protein
MAAIAPVDVLDHDLAPLMLEIDVDVRRLVAIGRDEALEQEIDPRGIDVGDAEAVAHRGIRRRAAALAQDALRAGEADDVVDGEEIGRVIERRDQREFVVEGGAHLLRNAVRITPARTLLGIGDQRLLGRGIAFASLVGIFVFELVEGKPAAFEEVQRLVDRFRRVAEQARHFLRRLEVALGIGFETAPGIGERHVLSDAGHDVLERASLRRVIEHVAGSEKRHPRRARDRREAGEAARIVAAIAHAGAEPDARRRLVQRRQERQQAVLLGRGPLQSLRHDDEVEPCHMGEEIVAAEQALALPGAALAEGEKLRQPSPSGPALGIGENVRRAVAEHEPRAGREDEARFLGRLVGAHDACHRIAVGDAEPGKAERLGLHHQLLSVGGPAQEREVGGDGELGISGHGPVSPSLPITSPLSSPGLTGRFSNPRARGSRRARIKGRWVLDLPGQAGQ